MNEIGKARAEHCLRELRSQIDAVDAEIIGLLSNRGYLVAGLGAVKRALGQDAHQPEVQKARRESWRQRATDMGVDPDMAAAVFDVIHTASVAQQISAEPVIGPQAGPAEAVAETCAGSSELVEQRAI